MTGRMILQQRSAVADHSLGYFFTYSWGFRTLNPKPNRNLGEAVVAKGLLKKGPVSGTAPGRISGLPRGGYSAHYQPGREQV